MSMKVLFAGSLNRQQLGFDTICEHFKSLVKEFARRGDQVVARHVRQETDSRVPIDYIVYEALAEVCKEQSTLWPCSLVLFKEPGVDGKELTLNHTSHTATTSFRTEFYKELLDLVDIVVCIGGEFGLQRLLMTCEWVRKPVFLLPGAGGSTDFMWGEFFKKFYQTTMLTSDEIKQLKQTPYINEDTARYSEEVYELTKLVRSAVDKRRPKTGDIVTPDNITLGLAFSSLRRYSLGLWVVIVSLISLLCTFSYYLGRAHIFD